MQVGRLLRVYKQRRYASGFTWGHPGRVWSRALIHKWKRITRATTATTAAAVTSLYLHNYFPYHLLSNSLSLSLLAGLTSHVNFSCIRTCCALVCHSVVRIPTNVSASYVFLRTTRFVIFVWYIIMEITKPRCVCIDLVRIRLHI